MATLGRPTSATSYPVRSAAAAAVATAPPAHRRNSTPLPLSSSSSSSSSSPSTAYRAHLLACVRQSGAYAPHHEARVAQDIHHATHAFPSLHPILDSFIASDGSTTPLVALRGTLPVRYKGISYKIPVHLWLMPYHPAGPPLVFVVPTRAMVFRKGHPHVDNSNGLVYMPYISQWNPQSSTLLGLLHALVKAFETKPPVYAKVSSPSRQGPDAERRALIKALSASLHAALLRSATRRSRDVILARDASDKLLQARKAQLSQADHLRLSLENKLTQLSRTANDLRYWISLHPQPAGVNVDLDLRPRHALREQEVTHRSRDAALSDAMDAADKAVGKSVLVVDEYVRSVRSIAREQFYERLMIARSRKKLALLKDVAKKEAQARQPAKEEHEHKQKR